MLVDGHWPQALLFPFSLPPRRPSYYMKFWADAQGQVFRLRANAYQSPGTENS